MKLLKYIYYSFPIQLVKLHVKYHQILLLFWILLFLIVTNSAGQRYGIPYLLLDPEYLGEVSFISFAILGFAFCGFFMAWQISVYILSSHRFPFIATLSWPFAKFVFNNSLIPGAFIITYVIVAGYFQKENQLYDIETSIVSVMGFPAGFLVAAMLSSIYFTLTNTDIVSRKEAKKLKARSKVMMKKDMEWDNLQTDKEHLKVLTYLNLWGQPKLVRGVGHYDESFLQKIFKQHHVNALVVQVLGLISVAFFGLLIDYPIFQIPAGASFFIGLSILVVLMSALSFWLRNYSFFVVIFLVIILSSGSKFNITGYQNHAYGLSYDTLTTYNLQALEDMSSYRNFLDDKNATFEILENWKKKLKTRYGKSKPKMILINSSGGGLSATYWSMRVLQDIYFEFGEDVMEHTILMTGASGGMIGMGYYRELHLQSKTNDSIIVNDPFYAEKVSKDLLNPIIFTMAVNDLFIPFQQFEVDGHKYPKDRGYAFEEKLHRNTDYVMEKRLGDYYETEQTAEIPMMIITPTIVNDQRKLFISPHNVSYLTRPIDPFLRTKDFEIDGVDFRRFFSNHSPDSLQFSTALRMNATYPYILPAVFMPSDPPLKVMDAGFRDNYGMETSISFIHAFKEWINDNTSGVVIISIRNREKIEEIDSKSSSNLHGMTNPYDIMVGNWGYLQDYKNDYSLNYAKEWLNGNFDLITYEYIPQKREEKASLSLHLTGKEKLDIRAALESEDTRKNMETLNELLYN